MIARMSRIFVLGGSVVGLLGGMPPVETLDDAIALVNAAEYGNAASTSAENGSATRRFRYDVRTGNISVNVGAVSGARR